ncbi:MAG: FMN-binding protein [Chloroflexota bacterium]
MQPKENVLKKLYPVIIVTIVVFASVNFLSYANRFTEPKIKAQEEAGSMAPLKVFFPEMTSFNLENDVYTILADGKTVGYAFKATGTGYHGEISIMVALQDATTVKGIAIVSQSETAGLGDRVRLPSFTDKFINQKIEDIKLKSDGGQIDGITGSTISSRAVVEAVRNTALERVKALPK